MSNSLHLMSIATSTLYKQATAGKQSNLHVHIKFEVTMASNPKRFTLQTQSTISLKRFANKRDNCVCQNFS